MTDWLHFVLSASRKSKDVRMIAFIKAEIVFRLEGLALKAFDDMRMVPASSIRLLHAGPEPIQGRG